MPSSQTIQTSMTDLLGITHPIMLAGMGTAAGPRLAAAVTNAGGIGVIGGIGYTPAALRDAIAELKSYLNDKAAPFGVDLLLPQLDDLITVIIETGTKLFVSAVGVPPQHVVDRLHAGGVLYMNMIGHPKHVAKCLARGVDIICAQGSEGGGHTGDVPTSVLVPAVARLLHGKTSPLTGQPVQLVAAGGIYCGASLAAALMLGAAAVWVGTRFVVAKEAGASRVHQEAVTGAGFDDTIRTIIFSGRPLRVRKTDYILNWEQNRQAEIKELTSKGILPVEHDADAHPDDPEILDNAYPHLMGVCAAEIQQVQSAKEIVDEMMAEATDRLAVVNKRFTPKL
ncbi:hypothetical protein BJX96DRAFT_167509 [Aspergillus floccosus]